MRSATAPAGPATRGSRAGALRLPPRRAVRHLLRPHDRRRLAVRALRRRRDRALSEQERRPARAVRQAPRRGAPPAASPARAGPGRERSAYFRAMPVFDPQFTRMLHKSLTRVFSRPLDAGLFGPFAACESSSQRVKVTRTPDRRHSRCRAHREGLFMRSTSR